MNEVRFTTNSKQPVYGEQQLLKQKGESIEYFQLERKQSKVARTLSLLWGITT
ncbi:hypothetical protein [Halobacillus amylolyticus]|uniref:Uncharacterized protein n=1 Tax=Halobacillus amylolyticus TaxID=2932259 RepID=A0ABY4HFX5_9BACI|nr:hypothetical protein [Halobacillus amylolyticus]UOR12335.1 hypothetical protein MUO15_02055 [Halobacillus amylolyticus]